MRTTVLLSSFTHDASGGALPKDHYSPKKRVDIDIGRGARDAIPVAPPTEAKRVPEATWRKEAIKVKGFPNGCLSGPRAVRANIVQKELFMARCSHMRALQSSRITSFSSKNRESVFMCRQGIDDRGTQFLASLMV